MRFVHFTTPDGEDVPVNPGLVADIRDNDGTYHQAARAVIVFVSGVQAVRETKAEVMAKLEGA